VSGSYYGGAVVGMRDACGPSLAHWLEVAASCWSQLWAEPRWIRLHVGWRNYIGGLRGSRSYAIRCPFQQVTQKLDSKLDSASR
jgi:hypothetical protein